MKSYCPNCNKVIDETEFMENEGLCVICYESERNLIHHKNIIRKEDVIL